MRFNCTIAQENIEGKTYWVARCKEVPTIIGQGDTPEEALAELEFNEEGWLEIAGEVGLKIPEVKPIRKQRHSGKLMLRISPAMHDLASDCAEQQKISLNQLISDALAFYLGLLQDKPSCFEKAVASSGSKIAPAGTYKTSSTVVHADFERREEM